MNFKNKINFGKLKSQNSKAYIKSSQWNEIERYLKIFQVFHFWS